MTFTTKWHTECPGIIHRKAQECHGIAQSGRNGLVSSDTLGVYKFFSSCFGVFWDFLDLAFAIAPNTLSFFYGGIQSEFIRTFFTKESPKPIYA